MRSISIKVTDGQYAEIQRAAAMKKISISDQAKKMMGLPIEDDKGQPIVPGRTKLKKTLIPPRITGT